MKRLIALLACLAFLPLSAPAAEDGYTPEDAGLLEECLADARAVDAGPGIEKRAQFRGCIGMASEACQNESEENQTTIGMVACALREIDWWDEVLNARYAELKQKLGAEEFAELRKAQRAWVAYKDAECAYHYFYWRDGTVSQLTGSSCLLRLTAERAFDLGEFLDWIGQ